MSFSIFSLVTLFTCGMFFNAVCAEEKTKVVFETSMGSFTLELFPTRAPNTVANFLTYVDEGYYDNTIFHRVIKDFVIQGGGFEKGMIHKKTHEPVKNESDNKLKNKRGTVSLARRNHPDTGTSQFYINLVDNTRLDWTSKHQPGYTVFGKISKGMDVIDKISLVPTGTMDRFNDMPNEDVTLISAKRVGVATAPASKIGIETYIEGEHYIVLDNPVATRDSGKIEVVEMFSYGCPHCYEFEPLVKNWSKKQADDVDFWFFPAVWNKPMKLLAQAFYTAEELNVAEQIHLPLFSKVVLEQQSVRNESDLANLFEKYGVDKKDFTKAFNSKSVTEQVIKAEQRVADYKPVGVPEIVVNGKYRIGRMRAGGQAEMLAVVDFLIKKERAELNR